MDRFKAEVEKLENIIVVRLIGELDANSAIEADDALQAAISSGGGASILIDCTQLHYISSAGLGVILSSLHVCKNNKMKVAFFGLQPKIKNIFAILGLEKIVVTAPNEPMAIQMLNGK